MKRLLLAACIASLAACGGGKDDVKSGYEQIIREQGQSLVYAFPGHQQIEVPTPAPVALRFTSAIKDPQSAAASITITDAQGQSVAFSFEAVDGDQGLLLTPDDGLAPLTQYTVKVPALALVDGDAKARTLTFTTRGLHEGPASQVSAANFEVKRLFPDGTNLPVADMSSLRLQLSQPIDRSTVKYGNAADSTINLTDSNGALVPASVLVGDGYLTIDPTNDMTPGQTYTLTISPDLKSRSGNSLAANSGMGSNLWRWSFQPIDTRPTPGAERARMVQLIDDKAMDSPLTGKQINQVPMYSVLLGLEGTQGAATPQAHGYLAAELAHLPSHPDVTPLTIKRGSLIETDSMTVHIGGEVPAGFDSGTVRMEFLSDATGYLIDNPFSSEPSSPKQLRLMMDMGISADVDKANGAVTQTIQHIELVGTAIVEDGMLTINAMGVVEPNVLGTERASALLSFYMQGLDDQNNAPTPPVDDRPLELVSLSHDGETQTSPQSPISLVFNKAIAVDSISSANITLTQTTDGVNSGTDIEVQADGSRLQIKPLTSLVRSKEIPQSTPGAGDFGLQTTTYHLEINGLSDVQGNAMSQPVNVHFELPAKVEDAEWSIVNVFPAFTGMPPSVSLEEDFPAERLHAGPALIMAYPGYPCVLDPAERDFSANIAGRCSGTLSQNYISASGNAQQNRTASDLLPLSTLPSNRPIVIVGTKDFSPSSVTSETFRVTKHDSQGSELEEVSGTLQVQGQEIRFTPAKPWEPGSLYAYTLASTGQFSAAPPAAPADCSGSGSICDEDGRPLQTLLHKSYLDPNTLNQIVQESPYSSSGGPALTQFFRAGPSSNNVLQVLVTKSVDENGNFYHDVTREITPYGGTRPDGTQYGGTRLLGTAIKYQREEKGVDLSDLVSSHHSNDPEGVHPIPNSVKILSASEYDDDVWVELDPNNNPVYGPEGDMIYQKGFPINGLNIGCGYHFPDVNSPNPWADQDVPTLLRADFVGETCPESKFTYIHSALAAEVTDEYIPGKGIKVLVWPSQLIGTSLNINTLLSGPLLVEIDSGRQLMRMRYSSDSSCSGSTCMRDQPIAGYIDLDPISGETTLSVSVDLHVDSPDLARGLVMIEALKHNILNVPLTMNLKGKVEFSPDGQMLVEQRNSNNVNLPFELFTYREPGPFDQPYTPFIKTMGDFVLEIPAEGAFLEYRTNIHY